MTIAPCRALARFRHREKRLLAKWRRRLRAWATAGDDPLRYVITPQMGRVDADQQWEKAHVAMMGWLGQALAQTRDAWTFIPPPPLDDCYRVDRLRGPENYWWNPALGAVGASAFIPPSGPSGRERK